MSQVPIYLDHNATTPCDPRVVEAMLPWFGEQFGNASNSLHVFGWTASDAVESARERLARLLHASPQEIIFLSGATEANNLAINGLFAHDLSGHAVSQPTEHQSVLEPLKRVGSAGVRLTLVPTERTGRLDVERLESAFQKDTRLVSVMAANNEIGTYQPLEEIGAACRERGILFHVDAAQGLGRLDLDVQALNVDLLTLSSHKTYGPKGVGALYHRRGARRLEPQILGGGQEAGRRSGTLNVPGIVGFSLAAELACEERESENLRLGSLRQKLLERLRQELPGLHLNGHPEHRIAGNLNLTIEGIDGDALVVALRELALSSGSACDAAKDEPSHVLRAIGLDPARCRNSVRICLGRFTTDRDVDRVAELLVARVRKLRGLGSRLPRRNR